MENFTFSFENATNQTSSGVTYDSNPNRIEYTMSDLTELHLYLRVTCLIFLFLIFTIGTIGNVMVTMVIGCSRDMRTSTNIFLVNLSLADLLVLVICTPTALIEVTHHPERWILGYYLCKFVPLLENIVANASVLTILAISFERYTAICRPLRANYICTKSRAVSISGACWILASIITSPMIYMINYTEGLNENREWSARCNVLAGTIWADAYTVSSIILFFLVPFFILLVTYGMISHRLTMDRSSLNAKNHNANYNKQEKNKKQVVTMLGTVVFTFFLCLLPFRILTLFVLLCDNHVLEDHVDAYNNFLYFSRIMVYLNSCLNPILYNVMSSKFRNGFLRLCNRNRKPSPFARHGTLLTNTTTTASTTNMSINLGHQAGLAIQNNMKGSGNNSSEVNTSLLRKNGINKGDGKTLKNLLAQSQSNSHSNSGVNGFLVSHRAPGTLYNGKEITTTSTAYYPYQEASTSSFRNSNVKLPKNFDSLSKVAKPSNNNYSSTFSGTMSVKSDSVIYSAYIPGRRSETVL